MSLIHIEVERVEPNRRRRQAWEFWLNDCMELVLNAYTIESRETPRHKWRVEQVYSRLNHPRRSTLLECQVSIPEDVAADALQRVCERLRVTKWSDARGRR